MRFVTALWAEVTAFARLPRRVQWFYARALATGVVTRDRFALIASARPRELHALVEAAGAAKRVVELGTGTAWTAIALALADANRTVTSYDPWQFEQRQRYLAMIPEGARRRIDLRQARGEESPSGPPVDLLFIDIGDHAQALTVDAYNAWRPFLRPGGVVAFHDYGDAWPGVRAAVEELGLTGAVSGVLFVSTVSTAGAA